MPRPSRPALLAVTAVVAGLLSAVVVAPTTSVAAPTTVPTTPGAFVGLTPARLLDTRTGNGAPKAQVADGKPVHLAVTGRDGVPATASAVVLTLTVVAGNASGYLTAHATGGNAPLASVVNWAPRQTVAGSATVTVGTGGAIDLLVRSARPVDLVADVAGYIVAGVPTAAGAYVARTPTRVLDTRTGVGLGVPGPIQPGDQPYVQMLGAGGVIPDSGVSAVVGTLTAVGAKSAGYLTVWPDGARPVVSSLNYAAGQTVANQVTVPLGTAGGFALYASARPVHVVFDVTGYIIDGTATAPGTYVPVRPARAYDTRWGGAVPFPGVDRNVNVAGAAGVPRTGVGAVVANLTATNTAGAGYLTVWPAGRTRPLASNLNWAPRQTVANQASLTLGRAGAVGLHLTTGADIVVDVSGYYVSAAVPAPTGLTAEVTAPGTPRQAVALAWDAPADPPYGWTVRRAEGTTPPSSPSDGSAGPSVANGSDHTALDEDVEPGTTYSYAVFAQDDVPNSSAPATVSVTLPAIDPTALGLSAPTTLPLPPNAAPGDVAQIRDIACPAEGSCTAVGQITDSADVTRAYVMIERDGAWSAPAVPALSTATVAFLQSVDCTSADVCVSAGQTTTSTGAARPLVVRISAVGVASATGPLPDVSPVSQLAVRDIDCTVDEDCLIVGSYRTTTATVPLSLQFDGSGVRFVPTTVAPGVNGPQPTSVSCAGTTSCVAVGYSGDTASHTNLLTGRWDGTSWQYRGVPRPTGVPADQDAQFLAVECTAAGPCVATGTGTTTTNGARGLRATGDGTTWSVAVLRDVASTTYGGYLRCTDADTCVSAYRTGTGTTVTTTGPSQPAPAVVHSPTASAVAVHSYDLGCDATLRCALAGSWEEGAGPVRMRAMVTTVVDGVATSVQVGPVVSSSTSTVVVNQVGCAPLGRCVVTGYSLLAGRPTQRFLQTFTLPSR